MAVLLAAAAAIAGAPGKVVDSRIEKVTVYSTAAQVTRTAVVDLEPGTHVLIFDKLPLKTYQDALGCHVDGQTRVLSLKLDTRTYDKPVEERLRALEQEVLELKRQIEDLDALLRALDQKQEFLTGIRVETPKAIAQAATTTTSYPLGGLRAALAFVEDEWTDLEERRLAIGRRKSELDARRGRLEAEQSALSAPAAGIETRLEAQVEIAVRSGGKVRIELTYLVAGASWRPYYDARLDRLAGKVEWSSYAEIRQRSGEDWEDIELSVATADPLRATKPPGLDPIYLGAGSAPPEPPKGQATALARTQQRGVESLQESKELRQLPVDDVSEAISLKAGVVSQDGGLHFRGSRSDEVAVHITGGYEAEYGNATAPVFSLAQLGETPISSIYRIERRESIPSDDSWHRATIAVHDFPAELEILTVPRKARLAYLHARSINQTGAPLLPGPVHLFTGSDFMGRAALDRAIAPGAAIDLSFGGHDRLEVQHELVSEKRSVSHGSRRFRYHYRTRVKNFDGSAQRVVVLDQVPVPVDSRIEVDLRLVTPRPQGDGPDPYGALRWEVDLAPDAEQVIEIEYDVLFPKEWQLAGL